MSRNGRERLENAQQQGKLTQDLDEDLIYIVQILRRCFRGERLTIQDVPANQYAHLFDILTLPENTPQPEIIETAIKHYPALDWIHTAVLSALVTTFGHHVKEIAGHGIDMTDVATWSRLDQLFEAVKGEVGGVPALPDAGKSALFVLVVRCNLDDPIVSAHLQSGISWKLVRETFQQRNNTSPNGQHG